MSAPHVRRVPMPRAHVVTSASEKRYGGQLRGISRRSTADDVCATGQDQSAYKPTLVGQNDYLSIQLSGSATVGSYEWTSDIETEIGTLIRTDRPIIGFRG